MKYKYKIEYKLELVSGGLEEKTIMLTCKCGGIINRHRQRVQKTGKLLEWNLIKL